MIVKFSSKAGSKPIFVQLFLMEEMYSWFLVQQLHWIGGDRGLKMQERKSKCYWHLKRGRTGQTKVGGELEVGAFVKAFFLYEILFVS